MMMLVGQITTSMVFNVIAACTAAVQFSLGIVAAANDRDGPTERLTDRRLFRIDRYDVYYSKMHEWFPCDADFDDWVSRQLTTHRTSVVSTV